MRNQESFSKSILPMFISAFILFYFTMVSIATAQTIGEVIKTLKEKKIHDSILTGRLENLWQPPRR